MKRYDEKTMGEQYSSWRSSGQSKADYAAEKGIRRRTFYYWSRKFDREAEPFFESADPSDSFALMEVDRVDSSAVQPSAIIRFPSGVSIEWYDTLEIDLMKALLH
ncbi:hypothetical protein FNH22_19285 [Fulvivirga sp. M361]|uniref:IS66 family insertion sequence element accessory protein TnpA n=1 Tax=Fulvivirga sp. M361 TaxID=2594266 RepID=UPI00117A5335|nr:hypothetical protein [Fulvivirga sp. M361]TRX54264.1 hypothetical protein FNH22_19285 [Fulvivirga sp. M361]